MRRRIDLSKVSTHKPTELNESYCTCVDGNYGENRDVCLYHLFNRYFDLEGNKEQLKRIAVKGRSKPKRKQRPKIDPNQQEFEFKGNRGLPDTFYH